jgi:hypothetical protein
MYIYISHLYVDLHNTCCYRYINMCVYTQPHTHTTHTHRVELKPPPAGQVRVDLSMAAHHIQSLNAPKSKVCQ